MNGCCTSDARRNYHLSEGSTGRSQSEIHYRACFTNVYDATRAEPKDTGYLMDQLPASRVQTFFFSTSVDYARPFLIKERARSKSTTKAYLCMFVCLAMCVTIKRWSTWR